MNRITYTGQRLRSATFLTLLLVIPGMILYGLIDGLTPGSSSQQTFTRTKGVPVSYDKATPPSIGCEEVVMDLHNRVMNAYRELLSGIRYAIMWGYLDSNNKGDGAIWVAQQIVLSHLGIETMDSCRHVYDTDMEKFRQRLAAHAPNSAIIMAGGGNFNDFFWQPESDHRARIEMIKTFPEFPIRAFPQSVWMKDPERIQLTKDVFTKHNDLQLAGRDQPSFDWLEETFGPTEQNGGVDTGVRRVFTPDIAFAYGNRSDVRLTEKKEYDVLIMARHDSENSHLKNLPEGKTGVFEWGDLRVTWRKEDWYDAPTPDLNVERGKNQRAWLKADEGFKFLGRANFVITDRLHGHILSTLIGIPHVLTDSTLGKNLAFHNSWTQDCDCTRIASNLDEALNFARMYFEKASKTGEWTPIA